MIEKAPHKVPKVWHLRIRRSYAIAGVITLVTALVALEIGNRRLERERKYMNALELLGLYGYIQDETMSTILLLRRANQFTQLVRAYRLVAGPDGVQFNENESEFCERVRREHFSDMPVGLLYP